MAGSYTSAADDLYDSLRTLYTSDTSSGLADTSHASYVRVFAPEGDPNYDRDATNWPKIVVSIDLPLMDHFGVAAYNADIRFAMHFNRNQGRTTMSAVSSRMYKVFHRVAPAQTTNWAFSPVVFVRQFTGPFTDNVVQRIIEAKCAIINRSGV